MHMHATSTSPKAHANTLTHWNTDVLTCTRAATLRCSRAEMLTSYFAADVARAVAQAAERLMAAYIALREGAASLAWCKQVQAFSRMYCGNDIMHLVYVH